MADETPDDFEIQERAGYLEARMFGEFVLERFNQSISRISTVCRELKLGFLLIDVSKMQGEPTMSERFELASHAAVAANKMKVAMVVAPEHMEPRKFGVLVARNRGLTIDIFTSRRKALEWLLAPKNS
jgi:hypothetical protein